MKSYLFNELLQQTVDAFVNAELASVDAQIGILGCLVGRANAGELLDGSTAGLGVETLHIT